MWHLFKRWITGRIHFPHWNLFSMYYPELLNHTLRWLYFELTGAAPYILIQADIFISMNLWLFRRFAGNLTLLRGNSWFNHLQRVRNHRGLDYSTNDWECSGCYVCLCICRCLIMNHLKLPPLMTLGCWISITNVLSQCLSLWKISLRLLPSD